MASAANVHSIEAIGDFRAAYVKLVHDSKSGLDAMRMDIRRFMDWLTKEQVAYWKHQIKKAQEELAEAKAALMRKKIAGGADGRAAATEEKVAIRKAQQRLDEAEDKIRRIKRWEKDLERAVMIYEARARQLENFLEIDAPNGIVMLDRKLDALERYLQVAPPTGAPLESAPSVESPPTTEVAPSGAGGAMASETEPVPHTEVMAGAGAQAGSNS
jgi:hypothetical protein